MAWFHIDDETMWGFEPHVAEAIFEAMVREANVQVVRGERLDLASGVEKEGTRIVAVRMESGKVFKAKMFIDATYEGDLMAKAGVSYTVGRESNAQYGETLNGSQVARAVYHQFVKAVDPFVQPGNPSSGLLPGIEPQAPGEDGQGDRRYPKLRERLLRDGQVLAWTLPKRSPATPGRPGKRSGK